MPFAIRISSQVNGIGVDSYLVEITSKQEVITTPKLIKAAIFWRSNECTHFLNQISTISKNSYSRAVEVTSTTPTDLGTSPSNLMT